MIALAPGIAYINEPFNPTRQPGICSASFPLWFQYVHRGNDHRFHAPLEAALRFRYQFRAQLLSVRSRKDLEPLFRDGWTFLRSRLLRARPLMKDPFAAFSTGWLAATFNMETVVVVRHPAGFAASLKRLGWWPPFKDLLAQPALVHDLLSEFESEMRRMEGGTDLMDQAGLMWVMIYSALLRLSEGHPDWLFVRHEDLAVDPVGRYSELFGRLGLGFTPAIERQVLWYSSGPPEREPGAPAYALRRDSGDTVSRWRTRLTPDEQERLRARVEPLSQLFYVDKDW
jgi:hypothetical protein